MQETKHYDAIVIGAGQGGDPLARALAGAGRRTALVERAQVGGTCINTGCTPTKTMAASARVAYLARRAADFGVQTGPIHVDMARVRQRKREIVTSFRQGTERRLRNTPGLDLLLGDARFTGPHALEVTLPGGEKQALSAEMIVINTGARSATPPVDGLDQVPFLDYVSIEELDRAPDRLLILGGGYIGLEFGQMFRRFGSQVTIVQHGRQLLAREDADVAAEIARILREDGLEMLLETRAVQAAQTGSGIELSVRGPDGDRTLAGSHLLVATGRKPNTDGLGLDTAGVPTDDHGYIRVNDRLETGVPGVYALGDVKGGPAFTHISYDDFRILEENLLRGGRRTTADRPVPYTVFTDPQLGRIGLTEQEARAAGKRIRVAKMPMSQVARAVEMDEPRGLLKAVVEAETDQILGAAVLGIEGGEIMAVLEVAILGRLPYTVLRDGVFAHPTLAEALNNLFQTLTDASG